MKKGILLLLGWLATSAGALAQQVEYVAEVDTNYLLIGDQVRLTLKVKAAEGTRVTFPLLKDTVTRGVEIIAGPARDSTRGRGEARVTVQEMYVLTAFDTGVYVIPALPIEVEREGYRTVLLTDPLSLIVNTYAVDADIVPPKGAPWRLSESWPYVLWGWVVLAVAVGIVVLVIRRRSRGSLFSREKAAIPPYVLAIQALYEIREEKPWQHGRMKEYYTRLTGALRGYMEGDLDIPALEQTTREILLLLEGREEVGQQERAALEELLEAADLVKFARVMPLPDEVLLHLNVAYDFVNRTNERVQQRRAEEKEREEAAKARRAAEEEEDGVNH